MCGPAESQPALGLGSNPSSLLPRFVTLGKSLNLILSFLFFKMGSMRVSKGKNFPTLPWLVLKVFTKEEERPLVWAP